ncbi:MAG: M23 family metallopeptidase, partial [Kangiellaceae bacterium]|nr:M23 family metallopeptidase [Kangiellaceae bacterium]
VAAASGEIIVSTEKLKGRKNYGTVIIIDHGHGYQTVYSHLSKIRAFEGDYVEKGQLIGLVGQTGRATGPHLHLEILKDNKPVDPAQYINFKS